MTYKFLKDVYHAPVGDKLYPKGTTGELEDWTPEAIQAALKAGLIREVKHGKDRSPKR